MSKKNNNVLLGVAGALLLATAVGLVIYKLKTEDEEDYYANKLRKIKSNFDSITGADRHRGQRAEKNWQETPFIAEDEFGVFL